MEPTSNGLSTSEGRLTLIAFVVGTLLEAVSGVLTSLDGSAGLDISRGWPHAVMMVVGLALQVLPLLGYQKARTTLKGVSVAAAAGQLRTDSPPTPRA